MPAQSTAKSQQSSQGNVQRRGGDDTTQPFEDLINYGRNYIREQPEMAALWCFGIGFILGWKLKPW